MAQIMIENTDYYLQKGLHDPGHVTEPDALVNFTNHTTYRFAYFFESYLSFRQLNLLTLFCRILHIHSKEEGMYYIYILCDIYMRIYI